jgi:hypothetical protein
LDQSAVAFSLSIATEIPTEMQQVEEDGLASLLSHKGSGELADVMEGVKNGENSSNGMPESHVV